MNWWFSCLANLTNITFERLPPYMNWSNMVIQMCFLQSLHNCCIWKTYIFHHLYHRTWMAFFLHELMPIETDLLCKACIINTTFERILSFMNWFYVEQAFWSFMFLYIFLKDLYFSSPILHLNGFFPSWTDVYWDWSLM